jgi:hypothetical protein
MKKNLLFIALICLNSISYAQKTNSNSKKNTDGSVNNEKVKDFFAKKRMSNNSSPKKDINIGVAYGLSSPSSGYKDDTYAGNGSYFEFSGAYYFSKWGLGLSIGQITNPTDSNLSDFTRNLDFSVANNSENIKSTYIGLGPEYKLKLNKFETTFQIRAGMYAVNSFALGGDNVDKPDVIVPFFSLNSEETTTLGFVSTGVKFDYNITNNLSLFASAGYLTALSDKLVVTESKIEDLNNNGIIDKEDFRVADGSVQYSITKKNSTPSVLNLGFGISYHFGSSTKNQENVKIPDNESDNENIIQRGKRKAKRECLEAGGVFWEHANGSYFCMNQLDISRTSSGTNSENELHSNGKRKCWRSGGTWVTNSHGSFCWPNTSTTKTSAINTENQKVKIAAKKECLKTGGIFWENADGSYSCQTTIKKSQATIKIPSKLAGELAIAKKAALADKTKKGVIEISVVYPDNNNTVKVSIPSEKIQDAETVLQHVLEVTERNGEPKGKAVTKIKFIYAI